MTGHAATRAPLLVPERVERDDAAPTRLIATVLFAGHPQRLVVELGNPLGVVEYVEVPMLLGAHAPSLAAVASAMSRWDAGLHPSFPIDLCEQVRACDPPFPIAPTSPAQRAALEAEARRVVLEVRCVSASAAAPRSVSASLVVDGRPMDVVVEIPGAAQAGAMRWVSGPPTSTLTAAQRHAIYVALEPAVGRTSDRPE